MNINTSSLWFNVAMVAALSGSFYFVGSVCGFTAPITVTPAPALSTPTNSVPIREASPFAYAKAFSKGCHLVGPFNSGNLSVFLVSRADANKALPQFVSLHDAIKKNLVTVSEGSTNELPIVNRSNKTVFVHSGDIFKGGNQDRMSQYDAIIEPGQSATLAAFCVEHDRSSPRGHEPSDHFTAPNLAGATNGSIGPMISAARLAGDQNQVWTNVWEAQHELENSTGEHVQDRRSRSSFELTLESSVMQQARRPYLEELMGIADSHAGTVGYIAYIDGAYLAGDVYCNHDLFRAMWPKMLANRATDAIMARRSALEPTESNPAQLTRPGGFVTSVNRRTQQIAKTSGKLAMFETIDCIDGTHVHATIARNN